MSIVRVYQMNEIYTPVLENLISLRLPGFMNVFKHLWQIQGALNILKEAIGDESTLLSRGY